MNDESLKAKKKKKMLQANIRRQELQIPKIIQSMWYRGEIEYVRKLFGL